jgi:hypothetical protein
MIDKKNGNVKFPTWDVALSPKMTREEFLASPLAKNSKIGISNEPHCSWRIPPSFWKDRWWSVMVYFLDQKICMITLSAWENQDGPRWEDWSKEEQLRLKEFHSKTLRGLFGFFPYRFSWGKVESIYDEKSASSSIVISYI